VRNDAQSKLNRYVMQLKYVYHRSTKPIIGVFLCLGSIPKQ